MADPSSMAGHPGWPLRNVLALVSRHRGLRRRRVVCWRDATREGQRRTGHSLVLTLAADADVATPPAAAKCIGWEKNERQKMGPRSVDLGAVMDPHRLFRPSRFLANYRSCSFVKSSRQVSTQPSSDCTCLWLNFSLPKSRLCSVFSTGRLLDCSSWPNFSPAESRPRSVFDLCRLTLKEDLCCRFE